MVQSKRQRVLDRSLTNLDESGYVSRGLRIWELSIKDLFC